MQKLQARITCTLIGSATLVADCAATCNEQHRSGRARRKRNKEVTERVERAWVTTPIHLTVLSKTDHVRGFGPDWPSSSMNSKPFRARLIHMQESVTAHQLRTLKWGANYLCGPQIAKYHKFWNFWVIFHCDTFVWSRNYIVIPQFI
jgi:hypothetical protein